MMSGMDVTQLVSNNNGHVVIFSAGGSQQSMVYTRHHTTSVPYVLQQGTFHTYYQYQDYCLPFTNDQQRISVNPFAGLPTVQLTGHHGIQCAVGSNPVHQVLFGPTANQYMPLQPQPVRKLYILFRNVRI